MSYRIIVDSCCDLTADMKKWSNLTVVPLTLQIGDYVIQDDENFNQDDFVKRMIESDVLAQSACPSPQAYADACKGDEEDVYIITITSKLSGSYNSALQGAELYKDENNDGKNIAVFDSLATSGLETLAAMRIKRLADSGMPFDEIVKAINDFILNEGVLYFCLESYDVLKGNGRLYNLAANVIEMLKVKIVGRAVDGKISVAGKDLTTKRSLIRLSQFIAKDTAGRDLSNKLCFVSYVCCKDKAELIKELIVANTAFKEENVIILQASGLNTLYASNGGTLIAFER